MFAEFFSRRWLRCPRGRRRELPGTGFAGVGDVIPGESRRRCAELSLNPRANAGAPPTDFRNVRAGVKGSRTARNVRARAKVGRVRAK